MIDVHTQEPVRVIPGGEGYGPHIEVSAVLLKRIHELLERNQIPHWVESQTISIDDEPPVGYINLGLYGDGDRVQVLLDQVE